MPRLLLSVITVGSIGLAYYFSMNKNKTISKNGLNLLKQFEGWRSQVYLDSAGLPTIGYGHLLKPGEFFDIITKAEGESLLKSDVAEAENAVNDNVNVALTQNMFDALVSFVYNIGAYNFASSTLLRVLNEGDYEEARRQLSVWNKVTVNGVKVVSQGLVNRRQHEQDLFV